MNRNRDDSGSVVALRRDLSSQDPASTDGIAQMEILDKIQLGHHSIFDTPARENTHIQFARSFKTQFAASKTGCSTPAREQAHKA